MNCLIMNGNPTDSAFDEYLAGVGRGLEARGCEVTNLALRTMDLHYCTGCWACWWKTPGLCAIKDGMELVYPAMARADLVIWASPLALGAPSSLMKTAQDRFIPLAHPYVMLVDGECHHRHRYEHNADIAFIAGPSPEDTPDDIEGAYDFFRRFSRNTRTRLRFCATPSTPLPEVIDAALAH